MSSQHQFQIIKPSEIMEPLKDNVLFRTIYILHIYFASRRCSTKIHQVGIVHIEAQQEWQTR